MHSPGIGSKLISLLNTLDFKMEGTCTECLIFISNKNKIYIKATNITSILKKIWG
jgi:hypothetical protein